ncbi:MAG TPA: hypothetical protein VJ023_13425 [Pyrinomonadaceae bacterium]|nr:hypothetical protein [Pyrinomonadaceae bacterium]
MPRSILLLTLLPLISLQCVSQTADPKSLAAMRPVKELASQTPSATEIDLAGFDFLQLYFTRHPGFFPIDGEPTKGFQYFVEAKLYGEEAIANAKFEAVDEAGQLIQKVLIKRQPDASGRAGFYGFMKVPDRPFRVVVSGESLDGGSYRQVHNRLFKPTNRTQDPFRIPPGAPPPKGKTVQQFEAATREAIAKMENDLTKDAAEVIVMPRTHVSNVMYAPYLSNSGHPLGVRITFDVEFSQDGYYNPELHLVPEYKNDQWRGRIEMKALTGSIEPQPAEPGSPQIQPHILAYGAGYLYSARTTYHFAADLVPDYVIQNENKTKFCIFRQKYKHSPLMDAAWREILASKAPTKYRLFIDNTEFIGEIDGLHAQGTIFESFVAQGAQDCGEQPTTRF